MSIKDMGKILVTGGGGFVETNGGTDHQLKYDFVEISIITPICLLDITILTQCYGRR